MAAWLILIVLLGGFPYLVAGLIGAVVFWSLVIGVVGFAHASGDAQLGMVLLAAIVGLPIVAIWLLVRLFRVERPTMARQERREPYL